MNEDTSDLLAQLRDIHTAADPGWWPPAPGWWVLAVVLGLALLWLGRQAFRYLLAVRRRWRLTAALEGIARDFDPQTNPHEFLSQMNKLFRVVALRAFPGTTSVRLQGDEWVNFLRSLLPEGPASSSLSALASGPYEATPDFDAAGLQQLARTWVKNYG